MDDGINRCFRYIIFTFDNYCGPPTFTIPRINVFII